jgi:hypothetical protein
MKIYHSLSQPFCPPYNVSDIESFVSWYSTQPDVDINITCNDEFVIVNVPEELDDVDKMIIKKYIQQD